MKKIILTITSVALLFSSCSGDFKDVTDFTTVENPNLSEASVVGQPNSAIIWANGIDREISRTFNEILVLAELGSDNYMNDQTFFSQLLDILDIRTTDNDIRDIQNEIARVAKMAQFGLEEVGPGDPEYTVELEAEFNFYLGLSRLLSGMYFSALPQETIGIPISSTGNLQSAISSFEAAIVLSPKPEYHLAIARANYLLGNKTAAVSAAQASVDISNSFTRFARYDEVEGPSNTMESALYDRATFDDLQPLPSLDFLDPKYSFVSPTVDPSVHYLKVEEAFLIMAEANLSDNKLSDAQQNLKDLLTVVNTREVRAVNDKREGRTHFKEGSRPDKSSIIVNGRSNLVLDRQSGDVNIPSISGTSLTLAAIDAMTIGDAALELLYRTRQEVFFVEGLRFVDMGIKLVINENEILQNENVSEGDPGTIAVIPSFIKSVSTELDAITYVIGSNTATTVIDLNVILVANKNSAEVLPFH
jgi:tetratricopeptide (TPR) repeat protein